MVIILYRLTDPTREMRMRNDCIRTGDILHSDVAQEFKQVYKDRQFLQKLKIATQLERARFLTELFKASIEINEVYMSYKTVHLSTLLQHAYKCCSKEIMSKAIEELETLHIAPKRPFTKEEMENPDIRFPWKGRQDAYSCLISVANAKDKLKPLPEHVVNQVIA